MGCDDYPVLDGEMAALFDIEELLIIDKRVDAADTSGLQERWEFGRELQTKKVGAKLQKDLLDRLCVKTGKSRIELQRRDRFFRRFPTDEALCHAVTQYGSWHEIVANLGLDKDEGSGSDRDRDLDPPMPEPLQPAELGWHQLGAHWLYCGDSTDAEFIERCNGTALAFADPPYNADKAYWDTDFVWRHDYLTDIAAIAAVTPGVASLQRFLNQTTMPYQWTLAAEITNGMTHGAIGFGNWIAVTLFSHGSIFRQAQDHMSIAAATRHDGDSRHPSRKPIRLLLGLLELFTDNGDIVVDPFLGSGTTLIAAEHVGRRCIGAELNPTYCADIINRYNNYAAIAA